MGIAASVCANRSSVPDKPRLRPWKLRSRRAFRRNKSRNSRQGKCKESGQNNRAAKFFKLLETPSADKNSDSGILPTLPNDVALQCLARVPRVRHCHLRAVSKAWRELIDGNEFLECRKKLGCLEDWLYIHIGTPPHLGGSRVGRRKRWQLIGGYSRWHALDPGRRMWYTLPPIPYSQSGAGEQVILGAASAVLNEMLYVIGGAPFGKPAIRDVWVYDPRKNKWKQAASLMIPRFCCLVGVIENKLYVVGGSTVFSLSSYSLPYLEIYDPSTNKWSYAANAQGIPLKHVAVVDGNLCVLGPQNGTGRFNGSMYDPVADKWSELKPGLSEGLRKPSTVIEGKLYVADVGCYKQYVPENDCWIPLKYQTDKLNVGWIPRLIIAMASSIENLYIVGIVQAALVIVIVPISDGNLCENVRFQTLKLPPGLDPLGAFGNCCCQIIRY